MNIITKINEKLELADSRCDLVTIQYLLSGIIKRQQHGLMVWAYDRKLFNVINTLLERFGDYNIYSMNVVEFALEVNDMRMLELIICNQKYIDEIKHVSDGQYDEINKRVFRGKKIKQLLNGTSKV